MTDRRADDDDRRTAGRGRRRCRSTAQPVSPGRLMSSSDERRGASPADRSRSRGFRGRRDRRRRSHAPEGAWPGGRPASRRPRPAGCGRPRRVGHAGPLGERGRRTSTSVVICGPTDGSRMTPSCIGHRADDVDRRLRSGGVPRRSSGRAAAGRPRDRRRWSSSSASRSMVCGDAVAPGPGLHAPTVAPAPRGNGPRPVRSLKERSRTTRGSLGDCDTPRPAPATIRPASDPSGSAAVELAPDLADVDVDVVRLVAVRRPPDRPQETAVGHEPAGVLQQDLEDLVLPRRQVDRPTVDGSPRADRRR